jgi:hypothetical protein
MHPQTLRAFSHELTKIAKEKQPQKQPSAGERATRALEGGLMAATATQAGDALGEAGAGRLWSRVSKHLSGQRAATDAEKKIFQEYAPGVIAHTSIDDIIRTHNLNPLDPTVLQMKSIEGRNAFAVDINGKKIVYTPPKAHPSILAHELGHQSGTFSRGKFRKAVETGMRLQRFATPATMGLGALGAVAAGAQKTPEEQARGYRAAQIAAGAGSLFHLPTLAEEARASIHAVNMGRKAGKGMEYARHLLPAFGTYAARPIAVTGATVGALELFRRGAQRRALAQAAADGADA